MKTTFPVKWALILIIIFSVAVIPATSSAEKEACYPLDKVGAHREKTIKREMLRRLGVPQELLHLVDLLNDCVDCVISAPDFLNLKLLYPDSKVVLREWSRTSEYLARRQLQSGKIEAFAIVLASEACVCCDQPKFNERDDWDEALVINRDLALVFDDPSKLGSDPEYLTTIPKDRCDKEAKVPDPPAPEPERFTQERCSACEPETAQVNLLNKRILKTKEKISIPVKNLLVLQQLYDQADCKFIEKSRLSATDEILQDIEKLQDDMRGHERKYKNDRRLLKQLRRILKTQYEERDKAIAKAAECETKHCGDGVTEPGLRMATITVSIAGEALNGPPKYRIHVDGHFLTEKDATWAKDTETAGRANATGSDLVWRDLTFKLKLPPDKPRTVKVSFLNDHYIAKKGDRNLLVRYAEVDDCHIDSDSENSLYGEGYKRMWLYSRSSKVFNFGPCLDAKLKNNKK